ncbi:serine hydrolase [Novosphingobium sp. fls2-241-R2A-195]|uniref:serine hydrolase domain-containing protein n=1 Tax=Novosphingobium sp. fls2-241-R2A-195 TaxID=3040296 RepID=UPI00254CBFDD|nr:serine hydrolase [Novosphingobium sp. fls2-241-R2A-195]
MRTVAALLLALSAGAAAAQDMPPAYKRNFDTQDGSLDRVARWDKYLPTERVEGATGRPLSTARPDHLSIRPEALAAAKAQADASHTMALLVYAHGRVQMEEYGPGFSAASQFDSYSSAKGLLALAVMIGVDKGYLRLDDPASRYISAWRYDGRKAITVGDLLWMQSGLAIGSFEVKPNNPVLDMFIGLDIKPFVASAPLARPPGEAFEFNHMNAQALHDVLVAASGMRYAAFLSRHLWKPLGLRDAMVALDHEGGEARTVCCFVNTPRNWLRIGVMLANGGRFAGRRILSERNARLLAIPAPRSPAFGMFMQVANPNGKPGDPNTGFHADDLYYFEGHGGQRLYIVPSRGLVAYRTGRVDYKWDDVRFANTLLDGLK